MCTGLEIIALAGLAISTAGTAYGIASAPSVPAAPPPPSPPPPPPGVPPPPKKAPTEAEASEGVARARRTRQRGFGLDQTILNTPSLGGSGPAGGVPSAGGTRRPTSLGAGSIF
jgi:hypothetical protein